jgi:hypothetical protein
MLRDVLKGHAINKARLAVYKMLSLPNYWNQDMLLKGHFLTKKRQRQDFIALPHLRGSEVLCDKVWVVNMGARDKKLMNSLLLQ